MTGLLERVANTKPIL